MIDYIINYFNESLEDIECDMNNSEYDNALFDGTSDDITRYIQYINALTYIKNNLDDPDIDIKIKDVIIEFNRRIAIKEKRLNSGLFDDDPLFIEYITENIERYQKFINILKDLISVCEI